MQDAVIELQKMGRMPSDDDDNVSEETIDRYSDLLEQVKTPISFEEAEVLITLFPDTGLYGVEWSLLHLFETVFIDGKKDLERYKNLLDNNPSVEWKETLKNRLANWEKSKS